MHVLQSDLACLLVNEVDHLGDFEAALSLAGHRDLLLLKLAANVKLLYVRVVQALLVLNDRLEIVQESRSFSHGLLFVLLEQLNGFLLRHLANVQHRLERNDLHIPRNVHRSLDLLFVLTHRR